MPFQLHNCTISQEASIPQHRRTEFKEYQHIIEKKKQYILACHSHRVHLCNVLGLNILSNFLWLYFQSYKDGQISGHLMIFQKVNIWFCLGHTIFQPWYCLQMKKKSTFYLTQVWPLPCLVSNSILFGDAMKWMKQPKPSVKHLLWLSDCFALI